MHMRWMLTITLYLLMPVQFAWSSDIVLRIDAYRVNATVVNTPDGRKNGLMHKSYLCENCGMLFVFPISGKYKFWMKDTQLPLSIAFITADGKIINIDEMQANSNNTHNPQGNALYALEMNKGWFKQRAIMPEFRVEGLELAPPGY